MRRRILVSAILAIFGLGIREAMPAPATGKYSKVVVSFDEKGRLLQAPVAVEQEGTVTFRMAAVTNDKSHVRLVTTLLGSLAGLRTVHEKNGPLLAALGISFANEEKRLRSEVCAQAGTATTPLVPRPLFDRVRVAADCATLTDPQPLKLALPPARATVTVQPVADDDPRTTAVPSPEPKDITPSGTVDYSLPAAPASWSRLDYDLRVDNSFVTMVKNYADAQEAGAPFGPLGAALQAYRAARLVETESAPLMKAWDALATCLDKATVGSGGHIQAPSDCRLESQPLDGMPLATALAALTGQTKTINSLLPALKYPDLTPHQQWFADWLWLTGGQPRISPLRRGDEAVADLDAKEELLAGLDAQVQALEKDIAVSVKTGQDAAEAARLLGAIRQQRDAVRDEVTSLKAIVAGLDEPTDTLLYHGLLFPSGTAGPLFSRAHPGVFERTGVNVWMQHHDALADYAVMARGVVSEIRETERVHVLVENVTPEIAAQLRITNTVTPITVDLPPAVEQALKAAGPPIGASHFNQTKFLPAAASSEWKEAVKDFKAAHALLTALLTDRQRLALAAWLDQQLAGHGVFWTFEKDKTPDLQSRYLAQQIAGGSAPAVVSYTIERTVGGEPKKVWTGSYRLNHLYRMRIQAGLLGSNLKTTTITRGDTAFKTDTGAFGAGFTAGLLYYLKPHDIRYPTRHERLWPPRVYLGFSVKEPTRHFFPGLAFEIFPAATLVGGVHLAREDRLLEDGKTIDAHWKPGAFVGLVFDPVILGRIFGDN